MNTYRFRIRPDNLLEWGLVVDGQCVMRIATWTGKGKMPEALELAIGNMAADNSETFVPIARRPGGAQISLLVGDECTAENLAALTSAALEKGINVDVMLYDAATDLADAVAAMAGDVTVRRPSRRDAN